MLATIFGLLVTLGGSSTIRVPYYHKLRTGFFPNPDEVVNIHQQEFDFPGVKYVGNNNHFHDSSIQIEGDIDEQSLLGIGLDNDVFKPTLYSYDPMTGNATQLLQDTTDNTPIVEYDMGCLNEYNGIYYYITSYFNGTLPTTIFGFDLSNNEQISPIILDMVGGCGVNSCGTRIACNNNNGNLYVWEFSKSNFNNRVLLQITFDNNMNPTVTTLGEYSNFGECGLLFSPPTVYDTKRDMIWLSVVKSQFANCSNIEMNYYYINALNGSIVKNISASQWELYTMYYDSTNDVIMSMLPSNDDNYVLNYFDPVNANIVQTFNEISSVGYSGEYYLSSYDTTNNVLYFMPYNYFSLNGTVVYSIVGVNGLNGDLVSSAQLCIYDAEYPWDCPQVLDFWN